MVQISIKKIFIELGRLQALDFHPSYLCYGIWGCMGHSVSLALPPWLVAVDVADWKSFTNTKTWPLIDFTSTWNEAHPSIAKTQSETSPTTSNLKSYLKILYVFHYMIIEFRKLTLPSILYQHQILHLFDQHRSASIRDWSVSYGKAFRSTSRLCYISEFISENTIGISSYDLRTEAASAAMMRSIEYIKYIFYQHQFLHLFNHHWSASIHWSVLFMTRHFGPHHIWKYYSSYDSNILAASAALMHSIKNILYRHQFLHIFDRHWSASIRHWSVSIVTSCSTIDQYLHIARQSFIIDKINFEHHNTHMNWPNTYGHLFEYLLHLPYSPWLL